MAGRTRAQLRERILVVGGDLMERVVPILERSRYRVERVAEARTALLLTQRMQYRYLLVSYPLPDLDLERFLAELRRAPSPSLTARLLLVTSEDRFREASGLRDEGLIAGAVSVERTDVELESAMTYFMKTAPRVSEVFAVRLRVVGSAAECILGETVNLSESGVLVRTDAKLPPGTAVGLEMDVRTLREPVVATAVVVRTANPQSEQVAGLGLQFIGFAADGQSRLSVCIRGLLAEFVG
jgi:CheY-like chemotaxis protein